MSWSQSRRYVLMLLGTSSAVLVGTIDRLAAQSRSSPNGPDVAIIGTGAAGLTAGWLLNQAGLTYMLRYLFCSFQASIQRLKCSGC